jgi:multicomponent Na+:H+ antiporter subunit D
MNALVVSPVLIPLAAALAGFLAGPSPRVQRTIGVAGALALLAATLALLAVVDGDGIQTARLGGWPSPFAISWVVDRFGAMMAVLGGLVGLATVAYSVPTIDRGRTAFGYYPLVHVLLAGVGGAFLTGDLFNLFVWFEVMLIASFVLLVLGGERAQLGGAIPYVTLNLIASALFLSAVGLIYGLTGTLDMAALSERVRDLRGSPTAGAAAYLLLAAFGVKAAVFPLFFWLPASYPAPPIAVAALFAGLLTKVGVYALIRVFTLIFPMEGTLQAVVLGVSVLTMATGVLGALAQNDVRRILSFHIVSQIGYMILGLAFSTPLALAGSVFYIGHHVVVKANLFLIAGLARRLNGSFDLKCMGGLHARFPALSLLFLVPALSLAGVPPLSGFFAKLTLLRAGLEAGSAVAVVAILAVGLLTLLSMTKIWTEAYWKPAPAESALATGGSSLALMVLPTAGLAAITVALGLAGEPVLALAFRAAGDLSDPSIYVRGVLGADR